MSSKSTADLTTENTANVSGQTTPDSITPTLLGQLIQDIIDSIYDKITDALTPAPISMTKAQFVTAVGASTLIKGQIITITDRSDGFPLIIQATGVNTTSPIGIWVNTSVPLVVLMVYTGITDLFTFPVFLDASGNLNSTTQIIISDASKGANKVLVSDANGKGTWLAIANNQVDVTNPTAMTGAAELMMGLGGAITPRKSGNILIVVSGEFISVDTLDETFLNLRTGTGAAPSNGGGATGFIQHSNKRVASSTTLRIPFSFNCIVSSLAIGTPYWIDLGVYNLQSTAVQLFNVSISTLEQ